MREHRSCSGDALRLYRVHANSKTLSLPFAWKFRRISSVVVPWIREAATSDATEESSAGEEKLREAEGVGIELVDGELGGKSGFGRGNDVFDGELWQGDTRYAILAQRGRTKERYAYAPPRPLVVRSPWKYDVI